MPGQITLVDLGDALLGQFSDKAHGYALDKLTEAGADVRLRVGVTAIHPDEVQFNDGSVISTRTVVWGGESRGLRSRRPLDPPQVAVVASTCPGPHGGRLPRCLCRGRCREHPSGEDGAALPQLGSVAQQSGKWAGQNIVRELHGEPTKPLSTRTRALWR